VTNPLQDLGLSHALQLTQEGQEPCVAGKQALGGLKGLVPLGAGRQQPAGPLLHSHLHLDLPPELPVLGTAKHTQGGGSGV
jgi:hypothetical protein